MWNMSVDIEDHSHDAKIGAVLGALCNEAVLLEVLGSWPAAVGLLTNDDGICFNKELILCHRVCLGRHPGRHLYSLGHRHRYMDSRLFHSQALFLRLLQDRCD